MFCKASNDIIARLLSLCVRNYVRALMGDGCVWRCPFTGLLGVGHKHATRLGREGWGTGYISNVACNLQMYAVESTKNASEML